MTKSVKLRGTTLNYDDESLLFSVENNGTVWQTERAPYIILQHEFEGRTEIPLTEAKSIVTKPWKTGLGEGFLTKFEGIPGTSATFETLLWVDNCRGELFCELIPYEDPKNEWKYIHFPTAFAFDEPKKEWYTIVNKHQGLMLPNGRNCHLGVDWDTNEAREPEVYGMFASYRSWMPWYGQAKDGNAFVALGITEFDGGYFLTEDDKYNKHIGMIWVPSLGKIGYRRVGRFAFIQGDYNDMAMYYREYARETGRLVTLKEKELRCKNVEKLVGCAWVHEETYYNIDPASTYYDHEHPEKNEKVTNTFADLEASMRALKEKWGLDKVYLHMDGWGVNGYDSHHPDYLPPCEKLGGWEGMKKLSDTMLELDYLFATHDQYRDYHENAESHDKEMAVHTALGEVPHHSIWYGGAQRLLCSSQAPLYVRRNFSALEEHGIKLRGTYLDVFNCVEADECDHPWHRCTRKQCTEYRTECFHYLMAHDIAVSSESSIDWAMQSLVFCHWAPVVPSLYPDYYFGYPVMLTQLVYHDCFITPSYSSKEGIKNGQGLLLTLLPGSPSYLPARPTEEEVARYRICAKMQEATQYSPMTRFEYLSDTVIRTTFENGVTVTADFEKDSYEIIGVEGL